MVSTWNSQKHFIEAYNMLLFNQTFGLSDFFELAGLVDLPLRTILRAIYSDLLFSSESRGE